ncbi:efflux RND transporter periplasmic adaptor subunit [uncultured Lamprocystis sp.]|jgi:RND family efflux transporter MFP subunit|uniref:efflux RND transporter periplasmic adaptor subunit n=1 Tax=uncultured Lamprocystis sp. TaxID=543132 RepID=UPI0025D11D2B|nr:biotin/lipoyl-binding protein [uncultured Lamprocystis sp.]
MLRKLLPFLILALGIGGFVALKATRPQPEPVVPQERVWRVETVTVTPAVHSPVLNLFGRVEAPDRVRAAAPVAGRLLEVRVRDGDLVAQGDLLARLDPADLEPRLAQARAELTREQLRLTHDRQALEQERALLGLAEAALGRSEKVQSRKLGTASDVDLAREQLARTRLAVTLREQAIAEHPARLAALEAKLAEAERDAARAQIQAPFDARIGTVEAGAGDQLQPNQTILTLYPVDGLYLRAKIPGSRGEELRAALEAGQRLTARANHAGRPFSAVLARLAGEADARGVDALLKVEPGSDLPLGAFVDLVLQRPAMPDTIALPFAALNGGSRVFAVNEGRLQGIMVERVGEVMEHGASEVLVRAAGLGPGTRVMITHLPNAVDGLKVQEVPERKTAAAQPQTGSATADRAEQMR